MDEKFRWENNKSRIAGVKHKKSRHNRRKEISPKRISLSGKAKAFPNNKQKSWRKSKSKKSGNEDRKTSAHILKALEDQRAKQKQREEKEKLDTKLPAPTIKAIPGFVYDEETDRYYPVGHAVKERGPAEKRISCPTNPQAKRRRRGGNGVVDFILEQCIHGRSTRLTRAKVFMQGLRPLLIKNPDVGPHGQIFGHSPIRGLVKLGPHPCHPLYAKAFSTSDNLGFLHHLLQIVEFPEPHSIQRSSVRFIIPCSEKVNGIDWQHSEDSSRFRLCWAVLGDGLEPGRLQISEYCSDPLSTVQLSVQYSLNEGSLWSIKWCEDNQNLIALGVSAHQRFSFFNIALEREETIAKTESDIFSIAFLPKTTGTRCLLVGKRNGQVALYDARVSGNCQGQKTVGRMTSSVECIGITHQSPFYVVVSDWSAGLYAFDLRKEGRAVVKYHESDPSRYKEGGKFCFIEDLNLVLSGAFHNSSVTAWSLNTGDLVSQMQYRLDKERHAVLSQNYSPGLTDKGRHSDTFQALSPPWLNRFSGEDGCFPAALLFPSQTHEMFSLAI